MAEEPDDLSDVEMGAARSYDPSWVYHGLFVGPLVAPRTSWTSCSGPHSPLSYRARSQMLQLHDLPQFRPPAMDRRRPTAWASWSPRPPAGWTVAGHTGGGPGSSVAVYRRMDGVGRTAAVFGTARTKMRSRPLAWRLLDTGDA
jgi:hypothetical protein